MRRRYVRKGAPKTKGWRKTGRIRRVKKKSALSITKWRMPKHPSGFIPDRLYATCVSEMQFQCALGTLGSAGGNLLNYFTVYGNCIYQPFSGTGLANGTLSGLALTAASPGMVGTINTNYALANNVANYGILLSGSGMYKRVYVRGSHISVNIDVGALADDGILYIQPAYNSVPTDARTIGLSKGTKQRAVTSYANGLKNVLSNKAITRELFGQAQKDVELMLNDSYNCANATACVNNWYWNIGYQRRATGVTTAAIEFKVRVVYDCIFFNPYQNVN